MDYEDARSCWAAGAIELAAPYSAGNGRSEICIREIVTARGDPAAAPEPDARQSCLSCVEGPQAGQVRDAIGPLNALQGGQGPCPVSRLQVSSAARRRSAWPGALISGARRSNDARPVSRLLKQGLRDQATISCPCWWLAHRKVGNRNFKCFASDGFRPMGVDTQLASDHIFMCYT